MKKFWHDLVEADLDLVGCLLIIAGMLVFVIGWTIVTSPTK